MTKATTNRSLIWARYTEEPTDRKREQIERALANTGARFAAHVAIQPYNSAKADLVKVDTGAGCAPERHLQRH
jgi:hypothetical protein